MTKDQLKTGHIVTLRNGDKGIVLLDAVSCSGDGSIISDIHGFGFDYLRDYNDDLTSDYLSKYDIMRVERVKGLGCLPNPSEGKTEVIWERPAPKKKYTYDQLKEILGEEFEIVKGD